MQYFDGMWVLQGRSKYERPVLIALPRSKSVLGTALLPRLYKPYWTFSFRAWAIMQCSELISTWEARLALGAHTCYCPAEPTCHQNIALLSRRSEYGTMRQLFEKDERSTQVTLLGIFVKRHHEVHEAFKRFGRESSPLDNDDDDIDRSMLTWFLLQGHLRARPRGSRQGKDCTVTVTSQVLCIWVSQTSGNHALWCCGRQAACRQPCGCNPGVESQARLQPCVCRQ